MEKNLFHLAVCGAIFMIAYELGQRKAWFANYGGLWKS
jgi:hypothetical protein